MVLGLLQVLELAIGRLGPAGALEYTGGQRADVAGKPLACGRREQIEIGIRAARTRIECKDQTAYAANIIFVLQRDDLGIDRLGDLLVDQPPRVPRKIDEHDRGKQHEDGQIDKRQLESGRAEELSERRHASACAGHAPIICLHGSYSPRRAPCAAAAGQKPCRPSSAAAKYARRSRWSAGRSDSPRRSPTASCASPPGRHASSDIRAAGTRAAADRSPDWRG